VFGDAEAFVLVHRGGCGEMSARSADGWWSAEMRGRLSPTSMNERRVAGSKYSTLSNAQSK
jgi:hypothetical protein